MEIKCCSTMDELADWWPTVRVGLSSIKRRQGPRATWTPEHVRQSITQRKSELWGAFEDGVALGFSVTQEVVDPFLNVPTALFVWMAFSLPEASPEEVNFMNDHLAEVARLRGYTCLQACTSREGLERRMTAQGWKKITIVLQKNLYED